MQLSGASSSMISPFLAQDVVILMHPNMSNAFVAIIETPSDRDLIDGQTEGQALCSALRLACIPYTYSLAATRDMFLEATGHRLMKQAADLGNKNRFYTLALTATRTALVS